VSRRRLVQALFVVLGLAWLGYSAFDLFARTFGDCFDSQVCQNFKSTSTQLIFWRGLCVAIILVLAYRIFRVEPEE
jgi:hypothetical protein